MRIRKTKINWIISDDTMVAFNRLQATLYHVYDLTNRQPFDKMKEIVLNSKPEEYNSWVEVIDLAMRYGMRGVATRLKEEWLDES